MHQVTITEAQLAYVLANTDTCGRSAQDMFAALAAKVREDANADVWAKVPHDADVDELFDMAAQAGLRPLAELIRSKDRYRIRLDGEGYYATFGGAY